MSEYSIRILSERAAEVKEDLAKLVAEEDQLKERAVEIEKELAAVHEMIEARARMAEERRTHLVDLQNDIARLQEQKPNGAPDPGPVPEPSNRTPEIDRGIRERHEAEERAKTPRSVKDPLHVNEKNVPTGKKSPKSGSSRTWRGEPVDLDKVSSTTWERAELAYELLQDHGGPMSQMELGREMALLLECKPQTGQTITSKCVQVLATVSRILWTGEHKDRSAVWVTYENATPEQRAAAGLGTGEENYAGKMTRWPTPSTSPPKGARIKEEPGSYEGGKRR